MIGDSLKDAEWQLRFLQEARGWGAKEDSKKVGLDTFACFVRIVFYSNCLAGVEFVGKATSWSGTSSLLSEKRHIHYPNVHGSFSSQITRGRQSNSKKITENLTHHENEAFRRQPHAPMGAPRWSPLPLRPAPKHDIARKDTLKSHLVPPQQQIWVQVPSVCT